VRAGIRDTAEDFYVGHERCERHNLTGLAAAAENKFRWLTRCPTSSTSIGQC
jgi:hypothetical protein